MPELPFGPRNGDQGSILYDPSACPTGFAASYGDGELGTSPRHATAPKPTALSTGSSGSGSAKSLAEGASSSNGESHFSPWLIIAAWIGLSSLVIFYNAAILNDWHFPYPVTLTTLHLAFQTVATQLLARYTALVPSPAPRAKATEYIPLPISTPQPHKPVSRRGSADWTTLPPVPGPRPLVSPAPPPDAHALHPPPSSGCGPGKPPPARRRAKPEIDRDIYWKRVVPIGFLFSASLVLSNAVYLYLSVAFIQMVKAASPVAVLLTSFAWGIRSPSLKLLGIVLLISLGIGVASYGEVAFSTVGFGMQVLAIVVEANRVVMIQMLLQGAGMMPMTSLYFFAPVCLVINAALVLPLEGWQAVYAVRELGPGVVLSNAAFTFGLNLAAVYLIQLSSLILSLSKVIKDLVLIFGSGLVLGTPITGLQWAGYSVALVGLVAYKKGAS